MVDPKPGQIWRDTYNDRHGGSLIKTRMIKLLAQEPGGRWSAVAIMDYNGNLCERFTKVSPKTLASGYVFLRDAGVSAGDNGRDRYR